jgi:nucleotide-binding universal stress UspA family protein
MLKTILIGLDGSEYSKEAVRVGIKISKRLGTKLFGLAIIDTDAIFEHTPGVAGAIQIQEDSEKKQYDAAKKRRTTCLLEFEKSCLEASIPCEIMSNEGSPLDALITQSVGYDLIMLGQKTYFEYETREGPCSTLANLLKVTPRPVLVVPKKCDYSLENPAVIAFDGSISSARALQLFTLLSYDDAPNDVHLLTVDEDVEKGHIRQQKALDYLQRWYGRKPTAVVLKGKKGDTILNYARLVNARLIVMGAYGVRGLKSVLFGSVARDVLNNTECLLFLCR